MRRIFLSMLALSLVLSAPVARAADGDKSTPQPIAVEQQKSVSGVVKDYAGQPLIGATVLVKGTTRAVLTDVNGNYTITNIKPNEVLVFSFIGCISQELSAGSQSTINVTLKEDVMNLEEVVVVGYGTTKKANLTGSVATVSAKTIESRPLQSASQALQGTVPGVTAVQSSGRPGSQTASLTVRGKTTLSGGGPLVIIDGVPGDMNSMNPNDIESMSVLKDGASGAIYGVRAANGVVLITTKKGTRKQDATVSYTGSYTLASPTFVPHYIDSYGYATLYNESQMNENPKLGPEALRFKPDAIQKYKDGSDPYNYPSTDWYTATFNRVTSETAHHVSINGGTEKTVYSGSVGMLYQGGNTHNNDYSRYNARFNVETQVVKWFKLGMNLSGYTSTNNTGWSDPTTLMNTGMRMAPIFRVYDEDGSFNGDSNQNPVAESYLDGYRKSKNTEWTGSFYGQINFLENLSVKGVYTSRQGSTQSMGFHKEVQYGKRAATQREGYANSNYSVNETIQVLLNYNENWGKHTLSLLGGYEQSYSNSHFANASRKGGGSNELGESLNTLDPASQVNSSGGNESFRMSWFGRVQYDFSNKYLFEANFRADASSRFQKGNRWGYFPSLMAAWRVTQEKWMENVTWLSNLKLRAGWGQTGNEQVGDYDAINTYGYGLMYFGGIPYQTINESRYANPELTWATVTNIEGAIEAGFLDNKLGFEFSVYEKTTNNMLLSLPTSGILGAGAPKQNAGQVKNFGMDMTVFHKNRVGEFGYEIMLNAAYLRNRITDLKGYPGPQNDLQRYAENESIGSFYGYKALGLFRDAEDVKNSAKRTSKDQPGDIKYEDLNDDGKIDGDDRQIIGVDFPKWTGGLNLGLTWRDFDLSIFFQGAFDVQSYLSEEAAFSFFNSANAMDRHLDRWTPTNLNASYPRITNSDQINYEKSDFWLQDASYIRLKNVSLGYNLPKKAVNAIGLQNIKVTFSGENMLTFYMNNQFRDFDPESGSGRGYIYSNLMKFSLGLKVTF